MLLQQSLARILILAVVGVTSQGFLLLHPRLGLAGVSKILVSLQRILQVLLPLTGLLLQCVPVVVQQAQPLLDVLRGEVPLLHHALGSPGHSVDPGFVVVDLRHGSLVLLDEILDSNQVSAPVGGVDDWFLLSDPGLLVLHVPEELLNSQGVHQTDLPVGHRLHQVAVPC